ncbi:MAG: ATP-binding protein [Candidatus Omnitrophica bacterium]|nr:ATP-binding protein [Candidatus Omnitrophota bacterium]
MKKKDIIFQSDSGCIRESSFRILKDLEHYGIGEKTAFEIKLCVEEAVRNAIIHGNKSDPKRQVRLGYWVDGGILNIEIEDEGAGFNHESVKDPTKEENLLRNSGRGDYLIKKLMDKAEYNTKGNKLSMVKKIN